MKQTNVMTAAGLLFALFAGAANAEPKTINDCEAIEAADAYNQCLASFGPAAHERSLKQDVPASADAGPKAARPAAASKSAKFAKPGRQRHAVHVRGKSSKPAVHASRGGRKRMEFSVARGRSRVQ